MQVNLKSIGPDGLVYEPSEGDSLEPDPARQFRTRLESRWDHDDDQR